MPHDAYELIAQTARYIFAALMLLIVIRAARITLVDSRRAARLRRLSPSTGLIGELVVLEGDERAKKGMRYPTIREGSIGSGRSADIRIRHSSIRRRHAIFQMTEEGLHIRGHAGARIRLADGSLVHETTLTDGANFGIGRVHLLLVLSEATAGEEIVLVPKGQRHDDLFDVEPDGYRGNPTLMRPLPETDRRDEFRRIRREVKDVRPASGDPYDDPFDGVVHTRPDRPRRPAQNTGGDPFNGIVRPGNSERPLDAHNHPSRSTIHDGIRRNPPKTDVHPDSLFDVDDDF